MNIVEETSNQPAHRRRRLKLDPYLSPWTKLDPYLSSWTKLNSSWIKDLNIKLGTLKQTEGKVGNSPDLMRKGKEFLNRTLLTDTKFNN